MNNTRATANKNFWKYLRNNKNTNNLIGNIINNNSNDNPSFAAKDDDKCILFTEFFTSMFTKETEFNENDAIFNTSEARMDDFEINNEIVYK